MCTAYISSSPSVLHSAPFSPLSNNAWLVDSLSMYLTSSVSGEKDRPLPLTSAFSPLCTSRIAASLLPLQLLSALHQKFCLHTPLPACKPPTVFPAVHTTGQTTKYLCLPKVRPFTCKTWRFSVSPSSCKNLINLSLFCGSATVKLIRYSSDFLPSQKWKKTH